MPENLSYTKGPDSPPVRDITLGQLLAEAAEQHPQRMALITGAADPNNAEAGPMHSSTATLSQSHMPC